MDKLKNFDSKKDVVNDPGVFFEWAAEDRRVVAYPCANNTVFNLCAFMPSSEAVLPEKGGKFPFNPCLPCSSCLETVVTEMAKRRGL